MLLWSAPNGRLGPCCSGPYCGGMRIHIAALGGTIASVPTESGGVSPSVSGEDIARAARLDTIDVDAVAGHAIPPAGQAGEEGGQGVGASSSGLQLTFEQVAQVGSGSITVEHLVSVVESARTAASEGAVGVVLTQGTDTLEETAFVLSRINDSGIPIMVTGAMRNPSLPGADGPANVRAAVIAALSPQVRGLASALVMADEIHDPVFVRKDHTSFIHAFSSGPSAGPLGWVSEDRVILPHVPAGSCGGLAGAVGADGVAAAGGEAQPVGDAAAAGGEARPAGVAGAAGAAPRPQFPGLTSDDVFPQVAVIAVGLDDSLAILDGVADAGYAGCVLAGVGGGHVPQSALPAVERLAQQMPVVYSSRTGSGSALENTYGYPGAEIGLQKMGLVPSGVLDPYKARLQLRLALAVGGVGAGGGAGAGGDVGADVRAGVEAAFAPFRPGFTG